MEWLWLGFGTYIGTAALGTSAQLGLVNTHPFRWVHHVLFAAIWLTLGIIIVQGWGNQYLIGLLPVIGCMALMPTLKAGTRSHCTAALIGFGCYIGTLVWASLG